MRIYDVHLRVESEDDLDPDTIKHQLYDATGEVDFGFDIVSIERSYLSLAEIEALAASIHAGQIDKIGVPYVEHVRAVSAAFTTHGEHLRAAGLLHDALEDGDGWTAARLLAAGVHPNVVSVVEMVTNVPGQSYADKMQVIAGDRDATLLKIADNAHNSREDRRRNLDPKTKERLDRKYKPAREILWNAVHPVDVETILERVNPGLLPELHAMFPTLANPWHSTKEGKQ